MHNMFVKTCQEGVSAQNSIFVRTLGAFSLSLQNFEDGTFEEEPINIAGRGRRIWMLIAYLVIHRDRDVPINELFEVLWNESQKRANPLKTLQHNVSRARDALANVGLPNARELIVAHAGAYRWNPQRATLVDLDYLLLRQTLPRAIRSALTCLNALSISIVAIFFPALREKAGLRR